MPLNMLMDFMSIPLFRVISPGLTIRSQNRKQAPTPAVSVPLAERVILSPVVVAGRRAAGGGAAQSSSLIRN